MNQRIGNTLFSDDPTSAVSTTKALTLVPARDDPAPEPDDDTSDFDWKRDAADIVAEYQPRIAVYPGGQGHVVIRAEAEWNDDEDRTIVVTQSNVPALIKRLQELLSPPNRQA